VQRLEDLQVKDECRATIGSVSNPNHINEVYGKAGYSRRKGIRPTVRGMAMHAQEHPHGGGEAKGVVGGAAQDIYGNVIGKKTRKKNNPTSRFILERRKNQREK
jgi:large subunit ribosomal protein L2